MSDVLDPDRADGPLYLEDLYPGLRFSTGEYALDAQQIVQFARQFDPQPFHLDDAAAQGTVFKSLAASGWHTAAITMRLLVDSRPRLAPGALGLGATVEWPRPTRPGDVLRVESEVAVVRPSRSHPDRGIVTLCSKTLNQRGEAVLTLTSKLLVFRRKAH